MLQIQCTQGSRFSIGAKGVGSCYWHMGIGWQLMKAQSFSRLEPLKQRLLERLAGAAFVWKNQAHSGSSESGVRQAVFERPRRTCTPYLRRQFWRYLTNTRAQG